MHLESIYGKNFTVVYGFLEISETVISVTKITIRFSLSWPVSYFFCNFKVTFMAVYGFLEISEIAISDAKITIRYSLSRPVSHFFCNF